ncbi:VanZ family protein [bacterium]|nr:VanZ family protein [bacterium]
MSQLQPQPWPSLLWRWLAGAGLLTGMVGIFFLSEQSHLPQTFTFPGIDKLQHATAFGILGILAQLAVGVRGKSGYLLVAILIVTCYAIFDELHQSWIPGRDSDFFDVLADFSGATLGAIAVIIFRRLRLKRHALQR